MPALPVILANGTALAAVGQAAESAYVLGEALSLSLQSTTGYLSFAWRLTTRPAGSTAALTSSTGTTSSLTTDVVGEYRIKGTAVGVDGTVSATVAVIVVRTPGRSLRKVTAEETRSRSNLTPLVTKVNEALDTLDALQPQHVASVAVLRAVVPEANAAAVLAGRTTRGDGGGGVFFYDPADTTSEDDGALTIVTAGGKRFRRVYSGALDVRWFGAKGDGVTDDTAAIQSAIDAANALRRASNAAPYGEGADYNGAIPVVLLPSGVYLHTGLTIAGWVDLIGDRAILALGTYASGTYSYLDSSDHITGTSWYQTRLRGLTFRRGRRALDISTNNVSTEIRVDDCRFHELKGDCIYSDDESPSTSMIVTACKFVLTTTGSRVCNVAFDEMTIRDTLVAVSCDEVFRVRPPNPVQTSPSRLKLRGLFGNPYNGDGCWVRNDGGLVDIGSGCRFGGESGGKRLVDNYASPGDLVTSTHPTGVIVEDSVVACAGKHMVVCYDVPNLIRVRGVVGANAGIWFDPSIGAATRRLIGSICTVDVQDDVRIVTGDVLDGLGVVSDQKIAAQLLTPRGAAHLREADRVLTMAQGLTAFTGYGGARSLSGGAVVDTVDVYGHWRATFTTSADNASYNMSFARALQGRASGHYTLVQHVEIVSGSATIALTLGHGTRFVSLPQGRHVISLPYYHDATNANAYAAGFSAGRVASGTVIAFMSTRVFRGAVEVETPNTVVYGAAAPITGQWEKGDVVINTSPSSGGNIGWVCTTAGLLPHGAWASATAYAVGDIVSASGNTYLCTVAGTSSGIAPTHGSGTATDGTVTWAFVTAPVFKAYGVIA